MIKKIILFSAPVHFIGKHEFIPPNDYEIHFHQIRTLDEFNSYEDKEKVFAWLTNPCPEFFIGEELISQLLNLKLIVTASTGKNHIDEEFCKSKEILVKGLLDSDVVKNIKASSEFTFLLCLAAIRNFKASLKTVHDGNWRNVEEKLRGREIYGLNIGIIGFGRIGSNLANYFQALGSKILAYDPYVFDFSGFNKEIQVCSNLKELLKDSDVVITSVSLNDETKNMVNEEFFRNLKRGCTYINTSRGDVVDEEALLNALETKKISSCALDVLKNENQKNFLVNNKLVNYSFKHENLIITPHIAGLTIDSETKAQKAAFDLILQNL